MTQGRLMRKKKGTIPEKEHQNQTLSSRAEKAMTKKKTQAVRFGEW